MRKTLFGTLLLAIGLLAAPVGFAQAPAGAPAGSTGLCNDGTYYSGATKQGACRGHKGVKQWWGGGAAASAPAKAAKTKSASTAKTKSAPAEAPVASRSAAPSGATGLCNDGTYYTGATKQGACRGHKGIKEWWGGASPASAPVQTARTRSAPAPAPVASQGSAPAGSTGLCNDGTYYTGATKQGACRGHKGVKEWWGAESSRSSSPSTPAATRSMPAPAPMASSSAPSQSAAPGSRKGSSSIAAAPGGGPGLVWLNSDSNVYHCYGTQWYGKTKAGSYMSESEARSKGAHPSNNRPCK
jgi:predicted GIY-YIG superfamily endonuclease